MAEQSRGDSVSAPSSIDLVFSAEKWRARFAVQRAKIGNATVVENVEVLSELLNSWPRYDNHQEQRDASALKEAVKGSLVDKDVALKNNLLNLLEQADRQVLIGEAIVRHDFQGLVGIVAEDRLEAVCTWKILTKIGKKIGHEDANFWQPEWKRALYIPELTSAPWNVGWPTAASGVSGAGSALVEAMKTKCKSEKCDGIGLVGLACNMAFYLKVGFQLKSGGGLAFFMDLRT